MNFFERKRSNKIDDICMSGIYIEMSDNEGEKYEFKYVGVSKYYPNQSSRSGYGSDEWMFLCEREENGSILSFEANPSCGYAWSTVDIPKPSYDELVKKGGKGIFETFYSYFKFEECRIIGLHPENIELVKELVGTDYSRMGKITDKDFYG